ncbi:MAG: thioredoxin family protein [Candidatus Bathyarchaeota archaeon]|nr:thioredoxin family protein [Candidatus Bathyarchaeota archaeon]
MYDMIKLHEDSEPILEYIENAKMKTSKFTERFNSYKLSEEIVTKLKCHADNAKIFVFSAEWCPDCYNNVPVLAHIQKETGLEVRVFGHLMRDAKNNARRWRIPPSPAQVEEFDVVKIPSIYILTKDGEKLGEIIENAPEGKNLEEAVLDVLES